MFTEALIYLDTNVFIYEIEGNPSVAEPVHDLVSALRRRPGIATTSELTLAEVLAPPSRAGAMPLHVKRRLYIDLIVWSRFVDLRPISRDILYETAEVRKMARLKLPDAIHLVTAIYSGCQYFVCNDHRLKTLPQGMKRIVPDRNGIAEILPVLQ